ncbi:MAG TPA: M1 family metallopeptidase [Candidatus Acidoferrales bacterium]|nr:M1 family metallopeptidase [Candidatus Acidoferrales bacterium]
MRRFVLGQKGICFAALAILGVFAMGHARASDAAAPAASRAAQKATTTEKAATKNTANETSENKPLSTRIVAYHIDARLDPAKHTITASESLTYKNLTGQPQQTFPFHLYLNAFQPQSTFMTEVRLSGTRGNGPGSSWNPKHFGSIKVTKFEVDGAGDLTGKMQFIQPDDHNPDDHTVFQVTLPKAVPPGDSVTFHMNFEDVMPEVVERTGYKRDFYMVGQWFPKVGVWWKNAWNCHQFHATTEFFADFGTFDVKVTVPQDEIVGAGGDLVASQTNSDGTKTLTYHSEDVHDFSWTASPHYTVVEDSWTGSAGTVKIHLLMSPGNMASAPRYLEALKGTLRLYDEWVGPYPYDRITVVDPPHGALDAGGMEYPTLITADTSWNVPKGVLEPEIVVEHEFGHQYWYGMVATNEFEEAWLDEGINSYLEAKVMDALYGTKTSTLNFPFAQFSDTGQQRAGYLSEPDFDPMTRFAWQFVDDGSYGGVTYGKTATVLLTLEKIVGEDTMKKAMHEYFMRYRFQHPTGTDFLKTIEDVSGKDLSWYFNQAVSGTNVLDYEITDAHSDPLKWYDKNAKDGPYRTYVTVHRKGDFVAPVEVLITFDDKSTVSEHWDGKDRWIRYSYVRPAEVASAQIDPGDGILLDRDFFNNSYIVKPDNHATHKLGNIWIFTSEWLSQVFAWLT